VRRSWKTAVLAFHNKKGPIKSLDGSEFAMEKKKNRTFLTLEDPSMR
jgi:hypothetical protein